MFTSHTHSLPITTGSGQTTRHYSSSYLCISKLPNYQIWLMQILPPSHPDSDNTLYQDKLSGQSNTSPKLRWTGNSPIWGKITVPTGVSYEYDHPTHTDLAYANLTSKNTPTLRTATTSPLVQENDRPHGWPLYTPLASRKFHSRIYQSQYTNNTSDRTFAGILELPVYCPSKMDQSSKPNKRIHHSK